MHIQSHLAIVLTIEGLIRVDKCMVYISAYIAHNNIVYNDFNLTPTH